MAGDGEVLIARQLTMLLTDRSQFEQLDDAYCRLRHQLPPTAALDLALADLLPASEHEMIAAFISAEGEGAQGRGSAPLVHHSLINGLEELYEQRQSAERHERREHMDVAGLAADLAADAQLAAAYREGGDDAGRWLERFPSMVLERASASPTPTGRRLRVDIARKALLTAERDYQARAGEEAEDQVAWCAALRDRLSTGDGDRSHTPPDRSADVRPSDEVDDVTATARQEPDATTPSRSILDVLGSDPFRLGDEDDFTALIEAANGHHDHHDPGDERTVEAMERILDEEVLEAGDSRRAQVDGRVRNELWTHMLWGYRVGHYLLTANGRSTVPSPSSAASYAASDLISRVGRSYQRQDVADLMSSSDLSAALHYHPVSSTLRRACGDDKAQARAWARLVEDLGFLTALGAEDMMRREGGGT